MIEIPLPVTFLCVLGCILLSNKVIASVFGRCNYDFLLLYSYIKDDRNQAIDVSMS